MARKAKGVEKRLISLEIGAPLPVHRKKPGRSGTTFGAGNVFALSRFRHFCILIDFGFSELAQGAVGAFSSFNAASSNFAAFL
jgi:hypothetical protein